VQELNTELHTWKLAPTAIVSSLWGLSETRVVLYARASGPYEARCLVAQRCRRFPQNECAGETCESPWLDPDLVECREVDESRYSEVEMPCVIVPPSSPPQQGAERELRGHDRA